MEIFSIHNQILLRRISHCFGLYMYLVQSTYPLDERCGARLHSHEVHQDCHTWTVSKEWLRNEHNHFCLYTKWPVHGLLIDKDTYKEHSSVSPTGFSVTQSTTGVSGLFGSALSCETSGSGLMPSLRVTLCFPLHLIRIVTLNKANQVYRANHRPSWKKVIGLEMPSS